MLRQDTVIILVVGGVAIPEVKYKSIAQIEQSAIK
jgi:hypothetical protein